MSDALAFLQARDFLLSCRDNYEHAYRDFRWPELTTFNWALDYFDQIAVGNEGLALWALEESGQEHRLSFEALSRRANQVANYLKGLGVRRGDRILVMLGNEVALWECVLALMKLGAVAIPATTMLGPDDLSDRIERGGVRHLAVGAAHTVKFGELGDGLTRICVGERVPGWHSFEDSGLYPEKFEPESPTNVSDTLMLYFTSGTTAKPKIVRHSHQSYPVGHLSTMYWIGLQPGDVHWNISSPGWAKHAWSSFFAPWNAGATVFAYNYSRFQPKRVLETLVERRVTTLCGPPTVWRMLVQENLSDYPVALREVVSAGEPLNPEVISRVQSAWNITIREGFGQTETTAVAGNSPGQPVKPGSMGRPLPGYRVAVLDSNGQPCSDGELCLDLSARPAGLMNGYEDDGGTRTEQSGFYHTGDIVSRDQDGYLSYVGRTDDVFKSSDYRISPFELESILIRHPAVAEAAVVPCPDPVRLVVPKGFIVLAPGWSAGPDVARNIFAFVREAVAPYKRIRRLEFCELPKTVSGKIKRRDLREIQAEREPSADRRDNEFFEEDFSRS